MHKRERTVATLHLGGGIVGTMTGRDLARGVDLAAARGLEFRFRDAEEVVLRTPVSARAKSRIAVKPHKPGGDCARMYRREIVQPLKGFRT